MADFRSQDFRERMRAEFLTAPRLPWDEIWLRMANARFALIDAIQGVSQEQADWTPGAMDAEDESSWSIGEVMRHVITASPAEIIAATARRDSGQGTAGADHSAGVGCG